MLQRERPEDFVISTGVSHSVREFTEAAAKALDMEVHWEGGGLNKLGKPRHKRDASYSPSIRNFIVLRKCSTY